jgi:predicted nicotinamide N-methyase
MIGNLASLVVEDVLLPWSRRTVRIRRPAGIEELLDRAELDPEQNLPYFAELWPSGIALADLLAEQPEYVTGRRTLEIGCGLGLTAIIAAISGADLTVADYFAESLALATSNLLLANAGTCHTVQLNWRDQASIDALIDEGRFPVVLAADVLYERRDIDPLLQFFNRILDDAGTLLLAEPGRAVATRFLSDAAAQGWDVGEIARHDGPWPDTKDASVRVGIHTLRRQRA